MMTRMLGWAMAPMIATLAGCGEPARDQAVTGGNQAIAESGAAAQVAILIGCVAPAVLAAFARVRFAADAVHRDGERLVRFGRQRPEAHRAAAEALDDLAGGQARAMVKPYG